MFVESARSRARGVVGLGEGGGGVRGVGADRRKRKDYESGFRKLRRVWGEGEGR